MHMMDEEEKGINEFHLNDQKEMIIRCDSYNLFGKIDNSFQNRIDILSLLI